MWSVQLQPSKGQPTQTSFVAGKVRIGRNADCDLKLSGWRVSDRHAELFVSNDQGFLRDLGSSVGTLVNGKSVKLHGPLQPGDRIQIGPHQLTALWSHQAKAAGQALPDGPSTEPFALDLVEPVSDAARAQPAASPAVLPRSASAKVVALTPAATPSRAVEAAPAQAVQDESFIWRRMLQDRLLAAFDVRRVDVHRMADAELRARTEQVIAELIAAMPEIPAHIDRTALLAAVRDEAIGLGLLEPLLADPAVTEIMVNRADEVFVERSGVLERYP